MEYIVYIALALLVALNIVVIALVVKLMYRKRDEEERRVLRESIREVSEGQLRIMEKTDALSARLDAIADRISREQSEQRREVSENIQSSFRSMSGVLSENQRVSAEQNARQISELSSSLSQRQETLQKTLAAMISENNERFDRFSLAQEQRLDSIRHSVAQSLTELREDNGKRLDQMRQTVDEKLQKTLEDRIGQSFRIVSERLEQVHKGLGEMQTLAAGVGDLKKVLSNVKTRGILGEIQLGAILEQILSPEQYETNVVTRKGSGKPVEFAVKLPGDENGTVYLPIDSKAPTDAYAELMDAYESGDKVRADAAVSVLESRIKSFAKDIHDKYVDPPATTDFAIMFLPFEGLYAEVVRRGLVETLQKDYKINVAGPSTMAALLNSLQMGFRTLAIQKRSGEVWNVLGAVKTEFEKFGTVLEAAQSRITQANNELDKLVGTRTRAIQRKLRSVTALPDDQTEALLPGFEAEAEGEGE